MSGAFTKLEKWSLAIVAAVLVVGIPALNTLTPPNFFLHVSDFSINLYGKYLCYAILAISVDVLWGYTGLLSLGQALFFTLGGYMMGMHLIRKIGTLGQYHQAIPDFLVFLGWHNLPTFWRPFDNFGFALLMVLVLPGVVALTFGYLAFRSRIRGVYFSILTQALTYAACLLFFRNSLLLGGNNGFTDFKFLLGHDLRTPATQRLLYMATALVLTCVFVGCRWLSRTKFGLVQQAIRDREDRVLFSGYAASHYKLFVFLVCALVAAVGGMLYVPQVGIINPSEMAPEKSLEAVVWVAVGGRGTLIGPVLGAIGVNAIKSWTTRAFPDMWLLILGTLFVLVTLLMPKGLVGLPGQLQAMRGRFARKATLAPPPPAETPQELVKSK